MLSIISFFGIGLLLSLAMIDTVSACPKLIFENGCCDSGKCSSLSGNCNLFSLNCAVCEFAYDPSDNCKLITKCSCVHCCNPKYAKDCPQGCADCIEDGATNCVHHEFAGSCREARAFSTALAKLAHKMTVSLLFKVIDLLGKGFFTKEEAIRHLVASGGLDISAEQLAKNASWFDAMDKNGNQKIEPEEFDPSLGGN
uniref:EF-hand domain-containing protein n=1 Tax=Globodera rostochiensis TaxID=31243 RepID=A0A914H3R1_GLORO